MNAIILAGGKSSRFGKNKAFVSFSGQFLIERAVAILRPGFRRVYIVSNTPKEYESLGAELIVDIYKNCGPLGGLHAGLLASDSQHNFVAACDMPFLDAGLFDNLWQEIANYDIVLPKFGGRLEMLYAVYSKNCLPVIEKQLAAGRLKLRELLSLVSSKVVEFEKPRKNFLNINTPADYEEALSLVN